MRFTMSFTWTWDRDFVLPAFIFHIVIETVQLLDATVSLIHGKQTLRTNDNLSMQRFVYTFEQMLLLCVLLKKEKKKKNEENSLKCSAHLKPVAACVQKKKKKKFRGLIQLLAVVAFKYLINFIANHFSSAPTSFSPLWYLRKCRVFWCSQHI